jgi:PKD repeat protein
MNTLRLFLFAFAVLLLLASCGKEPQASFTMSNPNPSPGEQVTLTNTSINAEDYVWEIDAGVYSTIESPVVIYPTSGTRTIHLTAIKRNKKSYSDQQIVVKQEGKATFWQTTSNYQYNVIVTIGSSSKQITTGVATPTGCDVTGCANFHLAPGTYPYTAAQVSPGTQTWNGNVTITDGGCVTIQLP